MNADKHQKWARDQEVVDEYASFVPVDGGNPTVFGGFIRAITRTGEGKYSITLKRKYPTTALRWAGVQVIGTASHRGQVETCDPKAGTLTIGIYTSAEAADDGPTTGTVLLKLELANTTVTRR